MNDKDVLEECFKINEKAFYTKNGQSYPRGVNCPTDTTRNDEASEQVTHPKVPICTIFSHVNNFLEMNRKFNGHTTPIIRCESLILDGLSQTIIDNGIIINRCKWELPTFDEVNRKYTYWDKKYDIIKEKFNLDSPKNIVWLKFTTDGYLAVVAKSFDINFDYSNSCGQLVQEVQKQFETSFVLVFPLTKEILGNRNSGDLELGIGQYLEGKGVPIIDYYSHNY